MADYDLSVTTTADTDTVYAVIRNIADATVWNPVATPAAAWDTYAVADWVDYGVVLTSLGGGLYGAVMPDVGSGVKLAIQYRIQIGATPAITDIIQARQTMLWSGTGEESLGTGVSASAWVSLSEVQNFPGFPSTLTDSQTANLINGVTAAIIKWVKRPIKSTSFTGWVNGMGSKYIWLDYKPITEVRRIGVNREEAASLSFDGTRSTGYTMARFKVNSDSIQVKYTYMGVEHATTFEFADYLTLGDLKVAVETSNALWDVVLSSDTTYVPSSELQPTEWQGALDNRSPLHIPGSELGNYKVDSNSGMIYFADDRFPRGIRNVYADYTGGYTTIPDDLKLATLEICLFAAQNIMRDQTLRSHHLGDESWTRAVGPVGTSEMYALFSAKLGAYRSPSI